MKFIEFLEQNVVGKSIILIEEHCSRRLVASHLGFGMGERIEPIDPEDEIIDHSRDFMLMGSTPGNDDVTYVNVDQDIVKIENDAVYVHDENGNLIDLTFYKGEVLPLSQPSA